MIYINIEDFPEFDKYPQKGTKVYDDSRIFEADFEKDGHQYSCKFLMDIKYNRWFYPETQDSPQEDECDILSYDIETIWIEKDDIRIREKEYKKIEKYVKDNITIS